jgi:hypothetical protein
MKTIHTSFIIRNLTVLTIVLCAAGWMLGGCSEGLVSENPLASSTGSVDAGFSAANSVTDSLEIEISGIVESVDPNSRTLTLVGDATIINVEEGAEVVRKSDGSEVPIDLSEILSGDSVDVRGAMQPDKSLLADRVRVRTLDTEQNDDEVEFGGIFDTVDTTTRVISLLGDSTVIVVSETAEIVRHGSGSDVLILLSDLSAGDSLDVRGTLQSDGSILADRVRLRIDGPENNSTVEVNGIIHSVDASNWTISFVGDTQIISVSEDARIERNGSGSSTEITLADIVVGELAELRGIPMKDGGLLAIRIKVIRENSDAS